MANILATSIPNMRRIHGSVPYGASEIGQFRPHHSSPTTLKQTSQTSDRKTPPWMRLLPSNINADVRPPRHSVLERRLSFPFIEHTRYSTPFSTPMEFPQSSEVQAAELAEALQVLAQRGRNMAARRKVQNLPWIGALAPPPDRKVRFIVSPLTSKSEMPTPELTQSPLTPASTRSEAQHASSHRRVTPVTPVPLNSRFLCATIDTTWGKQDVSTSQKQTRSLKRRLINSIDPQEGPFTSSYALSHGCKSSDATSAAKPTILKELSRFFASSTGK